MLIIRTTMVLMTLVLVSIVFSVGCSSDDNGKENVINGDPPPLRRITTDPSFDGAPSVSPDGAWIAFYSSRGGGGYRLWHIPFNGGPEEQLTTEDASSPRYSPDGNFLYFSSNRSGEFALYRMPASGGPATLIDEIPSNAEISPDGLWFVYSAPDPGQMDPRHIWKRRSDLSEPAVKLTTAIDLDYQPSWSPSGDEIVFTRADPNDTDNHLYVMNGDGSVIRPLTDTTKEVEDGDARWSPDGQWIAFERGNDNHEERIFIVPATGETTEDPAIQLSFNPDSGESDNHPCWSPNGNWIIFNSNRDGNTDIYVMSKEGEPQPGKGLARSGIVVP